MKTGAKYYMINDLQIIFIIILFYIRTAKSIKAKKRIKIDAVAQQFWWSIGGVLGVAQSIKKICTFKTLHITGSKVVSNKIIIAKKLYKIAVKLTTSLCLLARSLCCLLLLFAAHTNSFYLSLYFIYFIDLCVDSIAMMLKKLH